MRVFCCDLVRSQERLFTRNVICEEENTRSGDMPRRSMHGFITLERTYSDIDTPEKIPRLLM